MDLYSNGSVYDNLQGGVYTPPPPPRIPGFLLLQSRGKILLQSGGGILLQIASFKKGRHKKI